MTDNRSGRVRVLKFLNHFFIGGTERQFVYVANGLDRSQFSVDIACFRKDGPLVQTLRPDMPLHTYRVRGSSYSLPSLFSQLRLLRDVRRLRFDIVHTWGWYTNVFAVPVSRLALRPAVICSIRDVGAYLTPAKLRALTWMCRLSDGVIANSYAGRNWLLEQGVTADKIEVILNGIAIPASPERIREVGPVRKEFGIPAGIPICACIGRVVSGKGIEVYLNAARILQDRGRDVRFLMIGAHSAERGYQSEVAALARELNIEHRVIFTGQRQDVPMILREVDVVVHPSLTEGLSNVILEAMAAEVPVVATRIGAIRNWLRTSAPAFWFLFRILRRLRMPFAGCWTIPRWRGRLENAGESA
jgi:glycosyltransferase involved in cell wall biosynthesis